MKKYIFIFMFLFIFLSSCSVEDSSIEKNTVENNPAESIPAENSSDVTLLPPEFTLNELYKGELKIKLAEAIYSHKGHNIALFVDGEEYHDDLLILEVGEHVLEAYTWEENNKSKKVSLTVNIIDKNNKEFVEVYSEPNMNSSMKDTINIHSMKVVEDEEYLFEFINGELISWEMVKYLDSDAGYIIDDFKEVTYNNNRKDNIVLRLEDGREIVFNEKADNSRYECSKELSPYGYFLIYKTNKENQKSSIMVNRKTGIQYETLSNFRFSPNGNKIMTWDTYGSFSAKENKIQILSINENEITYEWTDTFNDFGTGNVAWIDEEKIQFEKYIPFKNDWERIYPKYREVKQRLTYEKGEWILSKLNDNENIEDIEQDDALIPIYESIGKDAKVIGSIVENEIDHITCKHIYQILNGKLILWFELESADSKIGYVHRGLRDAEYPYYDNETTEFYLILENGEYVTINGHLENEYDYYLADALSEVGYYSLFATFDGEGQYGKFINGKTGESFAGEGYPKLSKTKNKFIIANCDLEVGYLWNGIQIFNINDDKITLEYQEGFSDWGPTNVEWIDDNHLLFTKKYHYPEPEVDAELFLSDGAWMIRDLDE